MTHLPFITAAYSFALALMSLLTIKSYLAYRKTQLRWKEISALEEALVK